jgi:hypothetical protein
MTGFTQTIWYNKLLRRIYRGLPLPWHVKHRLKEIYLRRPGAWKLSHQGFFRPGGNRETLERITSSAAQFDPSRPWVLLVGSGSPATDQNSDPARMSTLLRLLREMSISTAFISDSDTCSPQYRQLLEQHDIVLVCGWDAARRHLVDAGGRYHFVLLSQPEVAFKYLPYVRSYALYSKVIYDTAGLRWVRSEQEMEVSGNHARTDIIPHYRRIELFNAACADFVLAATDEEKERLLVEDPNIKIAVFPYIHEIFSPTTGFGGTATDVCR